MLKVSSWLRIVGSSEGSVEGDLLGINEGFSVGSEDGPNVGLSEGRKVGPGEGAQVKHKLHCMNSHLFKAVEVKHHSGHTQNMRKCKKYPRINEQIIGK